MKRAQEVFLSFKSMYIVLSLISILLIPSSDKMWLLIYEFIFCIIFISTRSFENTDRNNIKYTLALEYWVASGIVILMSQVLAINKFASIYSTLGLLICTNLASYFLWKKQNRCSSKWLNQTFKEHSFVFTLVLSLISLVFLLFKYQIFLMISFTIICCQVYLYLSYQERSFLIKL